MIRAILIDPTTKTVSEVEYNGNYRHIHNLIECHTFTCVSISTKNGETIFVDDEGLLDEEPGPFFQWEGYGQPIAGKGLILGTDEEGESIATELSLEFACSKVSWPNIQFDGFENYPEGARINHPVLGDVALIGSVPVFSKKLSMDELYAELEKIMGGEGPDESMRER